MKVQSPVLHPIQPEIRKKLGNENYAKFMNNLIDYHKHIPAKYTPVKYFFEAFGSKKEMISFAFPWDLTPEGWGFWNEIDKKWRNEN